MTVFLNFQLLKLPLTDIEIAPILFPFVLPNFLPCPPKIESNAQIHKKPTYALFDFEIKGSTATNHSDSHDSPK